VRSEFAAEDHTPADRRAVVLGPELGGELIELGGEVI